MWEERGGKKEGEEARSQLDSLKEKSQCIYGSMSNVIQVTIREPETENVGNHIREGNDADSYKAVLWYDVRGGTVETD